MADKVPVQDELSKRISELIWCFEGTQEEDDYAGQMYLEMYCDDDDDNSIDDEDILDYMKEMEDEDGDTMRIVKNTLSSKKNQKKDEDEDEEEDSHSTKSEDSMEEEGNGSDEEMEGDDEEEEPYLVKHCRGAHLSALFVRTFLATVRREWGNMDKYRIDKFYTLIRLMMGEVR